MGGMALGAALCARFSTRIRNPLAGLRAGRSGDRPLRARVPRGVRRRDRLVLCRAAARARRGLASAHRQASGVACALILPQSILLGATFPLMSAGLVRTHAGTRRSDRHALFLQQPGRGCGRSDERFRPDRMGRLAGHLAHRGHRQSGARGRGRAACPACRRCAAPCAPRTARHRRTLLLAVALLTGLASFIYEICWIRMLSLVLGASTHSFELMLSTFILGLALGGLAVRRLVDGAASPERLLGWVQVAMGLAALATLPVYDRSFELMEYLMKGLARTDAGYLFFNLAGQGISALVMLPATFLAGMTLPLITGALLRRGSGERAIGQVYAANTLGRHRGRADRGAPRPAAAGTERHADAWRARRCAARHRPALPLRAAGTGRRRRRWPAACWRSCRSPLLFELNPNKLTAGVFRHGDLSSSARCAHPLREGRQDRDRAPGGLWRDGQHPHQRQVRRLDQHGPRRRARLRRDHHGADRRAAARAQARGEKRGGDRHRHRPDHARPAAGPGDRARRNRRNRGGDGGGGARLRAAQQLGLRRSARQHRDRRRQDLLLDAQPALRHPGVRALQPLGERRLEPVHARVLPAHPRPSQPGRHPGAVVPALRNRRLAARLGDARAGRGISRITRCTRRATTTC